MSSSLWQLLIWGMASHSKHEMVSQMVNVISVMEALGSNDRQDKELLGLKTEVPPGLGPRLGFAWGSCATWPGMTRVLMLLYRWIVWMRSCDFEALPICKAKVAEVPEEPAPMVETGVGESQLCILLFSLCFSSWSSIPMGVWWFLVPKSATSNDQC